MDSSVKIIMMIFFYVVVTSSIIAMFVSGITGTQLSGVTFNYTPPDEDSFWSSIPVFGGAADTAGLVGSFLSSLFAVLFWTLPESILPLWANIIFIKIPLVVLILAVVEVLLP